jgi:GT2 family glycosyltransferase
MIHEVPVIQNQTDFPDIPVSARMAIVIPTARWTPMARSVIGSMIGVANEEICVLIADNSENEEKREFLKKIRNINPNVLAVSHAKNIGAQNNFFYLYDWSRRIEFLAQMADDDWMSPTYFSDAYQVLRDNPRISCAEVGTTLVDMGDSKLVNISQPSMYGRTPFERMQKWNGVVARVTMYNVSRRSTLEAAMQFLRESPLPGMTMVEDLWELNRLALGEFVASPGHGCLVHYPEYGSILGDRSGRFYNLLCRDVGLAYPALFFMGLSTAVQCAIFLMGNLSPIADPGQSRSCAQHVFEHVFRRSFLPSLAGGMAQPEVVSFFEQHPQVLDGLQKYCTPPFSLKPLLDREMFDWFVNLIRLLETNPLRGELQLSERFQKFADAQAWFEASETAGEPSYENEQCETIHDSVLSSDISADHAASPDQDKTAPESPQNFYPLWQCGHSYLKRDLLWIAERMEALVSKPRFHLAIIVPEGGEDRLANNIKSLGHQFYLNWRLSIVATGPAHTALKDAISIAWIKAVPEQHLAAANRALLDFPAEWVGMWEAGDKLASHALFVCADKADRHPEVGIFFSDEDQVNAEDVHSSPFFKTDFNLEMLRAAPFVVGGLLLCRHDLFVELNGFDPVMDGVEAFDLTLRAWEKVGHSGIGHIGDVLYHRFAEGGHCRRGAEEIAATHQRALEQHLVRVGLAASLDEGLLPGTFHVRYPVIGNPLVSILISTKNKVEMLRRCLTSLIEGTGYSNCEILVLDNGSDEAEAVAYLNELKALNSPRLKVLDYAGPFNFSAINNFGASQAQGDYLLLLNNDTAVLHEEWLDEMLGIASQPDVGAVGAKLFYPDGKIHHAGMILGMNDAPAGLCFNGKAAEEDGYFGRLKITQEYAAVTAACMLVKRTLYQELGGLDEQRFQVSCNDVDFCQRLGHKGYRNVFTPYARLLYEESVSQMGKEETSALDVKLAAFAAEQDRFYDTWRQDVAFDPAFNRNLSTHGCDFLIEIAPALTWDPEWRPRPRILAHPADRFGCGEYRVIAPMRALNDVGRIMGWETGNYLTPPELFRMEPDVILLQRQVDPHQIELTERYIRHSKAFRVYEIDDLITNIPIRSIRKKHFVEQKDLHKRFRKGISMCDRFIVSTDYLAEQYKGYINDIVVVQNYIERARWGELRPARRYGAKPRVGWAGGVTHDGDLAEIFDVVKVTAKEVDWVFMGMCPDEIRPFVAEFHKGVNLEDYPSMLASLDLDLAVAPLEDVPFNHGKSHLRLLEYGVLGYPVICTDITPYRGDYPVTRVPSRFKDWVDAIRSHVADRDELARRGDVLRDYINANWILEDHLDIWQRAWLP